MNDRKHDRSQEVYTVVETALAAVTLRKATGTVHVRIDVNQGGITNVKAELTEPIKPTI